MRKPENRENFKDNKYILPHPKFPSTNARISSMEYGITNKSAIKFLRRGINPAATRGCFLQDYLSFTKDSSFFLFPAAS
jgi:hypothetical protein